jgi:hypothetical protein
MLNLSNIISNHINRFIEVKNFLKTVFMKKINKWLEFFRSELVALTTFSADESTKNWPVTKIYKRSQMREKE